MFASKYHHWCPDTLAQARIVIWVFEPELHRHTFLVPLAAITFGILNSNGIPDLSQL